MSRLNKLKKILIVFSLIPVMLSFLTINCCASDETASVMNLIDKETKNYLTELGVNTDNADGFSNISLKSVFSFLIGVCTDKSKSISKYLISVVTIIIVNSIISAFTEDNNSARITVNYISILCIVTAIIIPIKDLILCSAAVIKTAAVFTDAYVPILAAVILGSGNAKLAYTYNSFAILLSSFISEVADSFFVPVINMLFSFNILTSFTFESYKHRIFSSIKKLIIIILSLLSTVYTGLLTTQSILSVSSDSLTVRGIRFLSGTFIPIVGSGVSESVSSVISSLSIMRNTIGVIVIVIIMLIFLPIIIELLVWYFALQFCSITADLFGNSEISNLINDLSAIVSLINVIMIYITFVFVISTGIIIVMGK